MASVGEHAGGSMALSKRYDSDILETIRVLKEQKDVEAALDFVKEQLPETIEFQKELVLIEAPTGHEENRARRYAQMLEQAGLEDVRMDERFNVWGKIPGVGKTGKSVLLEGHLDTVFDFGSVKDVTVDEDGRIHCPGICDDTRALAANLAVVRALKAHQIKPWHDIVVAGTVCEEGLGGMSGMKALLEELEKQTSVLGAISIDGATSSIFYANATGMVDWQATFMGPGGHAWTASGMPSAVHAACRAAALIADLVLPDDPKTIATVSLIEGGQAIHGIAQRCTIKINARSNSQTVLDELNEKIKACLERGAQLENEAKKAPGMITVDARLILDVPAGSQPRDCRMIQAAEAVTIACGVVPELLAGGCTNTNMAIARGIPGVCLGRGGQEFGTHTLAEWFDPKGVEKCEQKSILLLLALAGLDDRIKSLAETL